MTALDAIRRNPIATSNSILDLATLDDHNAADAHQSVWHRAVNWTRRQLGLLSLSTQTDLRAIRNVLVIGIHGWAVLGGRFFSWSPSEVSMRMAQMMAAAIRQRLRSAGHDGDVNLTTIPLYGHGMLEARLEDVLVEQLPAHEQAFAGADAVFIAAHSQGAVLAGLLLDRLMERDWVSLRRHRHVGLLLMAGPHHGPFPHLPQDRFAATAEIFALGQPVALAERAQRAVTRLLRHGVRVAAVAADRDAVVPLFSAVLHSLGHHRRLLRGLYVWARSGASTFPARLVRLCLAWANTRREPSDLLPHLSGFYRGAFFDLNGAHSMIHTEPAVYDLTAFWFLSPECDDDVDDAELVPLEHTSAHWAVQLNDAFYYSDLNTYFVRNRLSWLLDRAGPDPAYEIDQLRASFAAWSPRNKPMVHLRSIIEPLFVTNGGDSPDAVSQPPPPNDIVSKL